jgi:hypothetical protein
MLREPGQVASRGDDVIQLVGAQTRACPDEALGGLNVMLASGICAHVELAMAAPCVGASGTPTARRRISSARADHSAPRIGSNSATLLSLLPPRSPPELTTLLATGNARRTVDQDCSSPSSKAPHARNRSRDGAPVQTVLRPWARKRMRTAREYPQRRRSVQCPPVVVRDKAARHLLQSRSAQ